MKKLYLIVALSLSFSMIGKSQSEFAEVWEAKATVDPRWHGTNQDLSLILLGDLEGLEMLDGKTGKALWSINAKERFGVKTFEDWTFMVSYEEEPVEVIYSKTKGVNTIAYLDPRTGKTLDSFSKEVSKKKLDLNQFNDYKGVVYASGFYDEQTKTQLELLYDNKLVQSAMGKGTEMDVKVKASGGNTWSTNLKCRAMRHLCDILLSDYESNMMLTVKVIGGKVFVLYEGLTVLDLATGKVLWQSTFDNVSTSIGMKTTQDIGRSAIPVADQNGVYVCDLSKDEKSIKKLDINTGRMIWTAEDKLSKDDIVSQLAIINNVLVVKMGGTIRREAYIPAMGNNTGDTYKAEYVYEGGSDVRGYDLESGKLLWDSNSFAKDDNFSKSESNMLVMNNKLFVCGQKNLFVVNAQNGSAVNKTDYGSKEIGIATGFFKDNDQIILEGKTGVASFASSGAKNYSVSTDKNLYSQFKGDAFIIWTGKDLDDRNQFIRFDLKEGKILGKLEGCYYPVFDTTGDYFIRYYKDTVRKYKTRLSLM